VQCGQKKDRTGPGHQKAGPVSDRLRRLPSRHSNHPCDCGRIYDRRVLHLRCSFCLLAGSRRFQLAGRIHEIGL